jgi:hypothetical protein
VIFFMGGSGVEAGNQLKANPADELVLVVKLKKSIGCKKTGNVRRRGEETKRVTSPKRASKESSPQRKLESAAQPQPEGGNTGYYAQIMHKRGPGLPL